VALAVDRGFDGVDVTSRRSPITVAMGEPVDDDVVQVGPRVGISAAADWAYRFWIDGDPTVSAYRPHVPRKRASRKPA
jgi:DNA-3-methyladenine glycosylase